MNFVHNNDMEFHKFCEVHEVINRLFANYWIMTVNEIQVFYYLVLAMDYNGLDLF